jgi:hypothetical protein
MCDGEKATEVVHLPWAMIHAQKAHRPRIAKKMGVVEIVPDDPTLSLQPLSQVCVAEY